MDGTRNPIINTLPKSHRKNFELASPRATFPPKKDRTIWTPNLEKIGKSFFCQRYLHANFYVLRKIVASDMVIWVAKLQPTGGSTT